MTTTPTRTLRRKPKPETFLRGVDTPTLLGYIKDMGERDNFQIHPHFTHTTHTSNIMAVKYFVVSGPAGTTTIAARNQYEAKKQYKEETGRGAARAELA